jgi:hypothetical protein
MLVDGMMGLCVLDTEGRALGFANRFEIKADTAVALWKHLRDDAGARAFEARNIFSRNYGFPAAQPNALPFPLSGEQMTFVTSASDGPRDLLHVIASTKYLFVAWCMRLRSAHSTQHGTALPLGRLLTCAVRVVLCCVCVCVCVCVCACSV